MQFQDQVVTLWDVPMQSLNLYGGGLYSPEALKRDSFKLWPTAGGASFLKKHVLNGCTYMPKVPASETCFLRVVQGLKCQRTPFVGHRMLQMRSHELGCPWLLFLKAAKKTPLWADLCRTCRKVNVIIWGHVCVTRGFIMVIVGHKSHNCSTGSLTLFC